jgi:hypothetical protein
MRPRGAARSDLRKPRGLVPVTAALVIFLTGCSTLRPVQPLPRGETTVAASLGGPLINTLGTVFPTPVLTVGAARGLGEAFGQPWSASAGWNLTAALFGVLHVEPGLVTYPLISSDGWTPTLAVAGSLHVLANRHDWLVAPQVAAVASWWRDRFGFYGGAEVAMALVRPARPIAGPLAGAQVSRGRGFFGLEVKWLALHYDVEPAAPNWISPLHRGYFSVLLGGGYRFGGSR